MYLDTLRLDIVKDELVARRALVINPASKSNLSILARFARLERIVVLDKIPGIVGGMKLVRVWVGVLGLPELVNASRSNFEILLYL